MRWLNEIRLFIFLYESNEMNSYFGWSWHDYALENDV